jgi:hypothetical protein
VTTAIAKYVRADKTAIMVKTLFGQDLGGSGIGDDSYREMGAGKLVVSGKKTKNSWRCGWFQYVNSSHQDTVEKCFHCLVVSELLLVRYWQTWKVPRFWLFYMALARIQEDRLVRARA